MRRGGSLPTIEYMNENADRRPPLAERMRPRTFEDMVGQEALLGPSGVVPALIRSGRPPSLILWGPPGCGKTTIARIVANTLKLDPVAISAVTSGVKDIKEIVEQARIRRLETRSTVSTRRSRTRSWVRSRRAC
jgi:replication-associated recombination protein RarA